MKSLYEIDYYKWLEQQVFLLKNRDFEQLDLDNLLEELESSLMSCKRELRSYLNVLFLHLLKYHYQKTVLNDPWVEDRVAHLWLVSIINARSQIKLLLEENAHLKPVVAEIFPETYQMAKRAAIKEMNSHARSTAQRLNKDSFPDQCPWTFEQTMDDDWLPEEVNDEKFV